MISFILDQRGCIGALDGTHVKACVPAHMVDKFRGRKSYPSQNVLAVVDFDLWFTYVPAGWEGSAHDSLVLKDALTRLAGLKIPQGKIFMADAGYTARPGMLPPYRGVRYHLNEFAGVTQLPHKNYSTTGIHHLGPQLNEHLQL